MCFNLVFSTRIMVGAVCSAILCAGVVLFSVPSSAAAPAEPPRDVKRLILEEQKIEGKIRRPQLVLIKADQRPEFEPMVMQSLGKKADIVKNVDPAVIDASPYAGPFRFEGKAIVNFAP
jgi:hypothetical protein